MVNGLHASIAHDPGLLEARPVIRCPCVHRHCRCDADTSLVAGRYEGVARHGDRRGSVQGTPAGRNRIPVSVASLYWPFVFKKSNAS